MSNIKNLFKDRMISNSIIYIGSNLMLKAFNFLLLPLYTAYLTTSDYGITNLVNRFQNVSSYLVSFCLQVAAVRFFAEYKNDNEKTKRLFGTIISFTFFSGIAFFILCLSLNSILVKLVFSGILYWPTIFMSTIALIFITLFSVFQEIMKGMQKAKCVAVASFSYFFIQLGLNILTVVILKKGANGVIFSSVISNSLVSIAMLAYLIKIKKIRLGIDFCILKETIKYSIPLLPHNIAASVSQFVSNVFINNFASLSTVGIFGLASQFGSIAEMVQSSSNTAFQPWFYDEMNDKRAEYVKRIRDKSSLLVWFYGFVLIGLSYFSKEVILLFCNASYWSAWTVVPLIVLVYVANIPYFFYVNFLFYYKKGTKYVFYATLPASVLNILLSYFFIQQWDMYGSVVSDIIFVIVKMLIIYFLSRKFDKTTLSIRSFVFKIFIILLIAIVGILPSYLLFSNCVSFAEIGYKFLLLLAYLAVVIILCRKQLSEWRHK